LDHAWTLIDCEFQAGQRVKTMPTYLYLYNKRAAAELHRGKTMTSSRCWTVTMQVSRILAKCKFLSDLFVYGSNF
jgi:hypothetical protein